MGQAISRRVMPRISKAIETHESVLTKDALDDIARKRAQAAASNSKYIDPSAMQGFKRDQWSPSETLPSERVQNDFLASTKGNKGSAQELPEDLIKFLNDAGPLEKKVDKDLTSPKVYESLLDEQEQMRQQQQSRQRRRRMMPMISSEGDAVDTHSEGKEENDMDGTMVSKTTNFSTKKIDEGRPGIHLEDDEIFSLLSDYQKEEISAESFIDKRLSDVENGSNAMSDEEKREYIELVNNMLQYTGVPLLMQDTDKSYVGAWNSKVEDLKLAGVRPVNVGVELNIQHSVKQKLNLKDNK
jgi:hypothetical protein